MVCCLFCRMAILKSLQSNNWFCPVLNSEHVLGMSAWKNNSSWSFCTFSKIEFEVLERNWSNMGPINQKLNLAYDTEF